MLTMKKLKMTMDGFPTEWEGMTDDKRFTYIRYRAGRLRVCVSLPGGTWADALDSEPLFDKRLTDEMAGILSTEEMLAATGINVAKVS